jgi:hypothetical protein
MILLLSMMVRQSFIRAIEFQPSEPLSILFYFFLSFFLPQLVLSGGKDPFLILNLLSLLFQICLKLFALKILPNLLNGRE